LSQTSHRLGAHIRLPFASHTRSLKLSLLSPDCRLFVVFDQGCYMTDYSFSSGESSTLGPQAAFSVREERPSIESSYSSPPPSPNMILFYFSSFGILIPISPRFRLLLFDLRAQPPCGPLRASRRSFSFSPRVLVLSFFLLILGSFLNDASRLRVFSSTTLVCPLLPLLLSLFFFRQRSVPHLRR